MKISHKMVLHIYFMAVVGHVVGTIWPLVIPDVHILTMPSELNMPPLFTTIWILTMVGLALGVVTAVLSDRHNETKGRSHPSAEAHPHRH